MGDTEEDWQRRRRKLLAPWRPEIVAAAIGRRPGRHGSMEPTTETIAIHIAVKATLWRVSCHACHDLSLNDISASYMRRSEFRCLVPRLRMAIPSVTISGQHGATATVSVSSSSQSVIFSLHLLVCIHFNISLLYSIHSFSFISSWFATIMRLQRETKV